MNWIYRLLNRIHLNKRRIPVKPYSVSNESNFQRVLNCLRENKVMVSTRDDGIYIRLAGDIAKSEAFSSEWGKVLSFNCGFLPDDELERLLIDTDSFNDCPTEKDKDRVRISYRKVEAENLTQIEKYGSVEKWYLSGEGRLMAFG